jgi:hypothetical protein
MECYFNKNKLCDILVEKKCNGCGWFKTEEQFKEAENKAYARLNKSDQKQFYYDTYYRRKMSYSKFNQILEEAERSLK